jgi:hypothetical protein
MENRIIENDPMMNDIPFLEREFGVFNGQHHFLHLATIPLQDLVSEEKMNHYKIFFTDMMFHHLQGVYIEHMDSYCSKNPSRFESVFHFCMSMSDGKNLYLYFYKPQFFEHEKRHYPELLELPLIDRAEMLWYEAQHHNLDGVYKYDNEISSLCDFFCETIDDLINFLSTIGFDRHHLTTRIHDNQKGKQFMRTSDE